MKSLFEQIARYQRPVVLAAGFVLIAAFLLSLKRHYHPGTGFTSLIRFGAEFEIRHPNLDETVYYLHDDWGYDGQFYAQIAAAPNLSDPALYDAVDNLPYRARRILFSWTAWAMALGSPQWAIHIYAVQNIIFWFLTAWLLTHWLPLTTPFNVARWGACLFSAGLISSVEAALPDGPGIFLLLVALRLAEGNRPLVAAATLGVSGFGRETNVLAAISLPWKEMSWWRRFVALGLVGVPATVWMVWLYFRFPTGEVTGTGNFSLPFNGVYKASNDILEAAGRDDLYWYKYSAYAIAGHLVQTLYFFIRRTPANVFWRLGLLYAAFGLFLGPAVWEGVPGAFPRVLLPVAFAFNLCLRPGRGGWAWWALGNLGVLYSWKTLRIPPLGWFS